MRTFLLLCCSLYFCLATAQGQSAKNKSYHLFDGKTFNGWEGDTINVWHIADSAIVGGSLTDTVIHNFFLSTKERFQDFEITLQFKLIGTGFVNAGVQFHSERFKAPGYDMIGYQADLGNGYWASLYDESRRKLTIVKPDSILINTILKVNDWNAYTVKSVGRRIRIWLNGVQTVDYTEPDEKIPHEGLIALQIHGGGKALVSYKNIVITRL